jgi:hypothetical protein
MSSYQLAQLNVGWSRGGPDSPVMAEFMAALDRINALAEISPGFVWRLQTVEGNATAYRAFGDDRTLVNLSVWEDAESLAEFVYRSSHANVMRRRVEWFERMPEDYLVLWWVPAHHCPSLLEAEERLLHLRAHGPTASAFTIRKRFPPPGDLGDAGDVEGLDDRWSCPAGG